MQESYYVVNHYIVYKDFRDKFLKNKIVEPLNLKKDILKYEKNLKNIEVIRSLNDDHEKANKLFSGDNIFSQLLSHVKTAKNIEPCIIQKIGALELYFSGGSILGDDLGLGKTLTTFMTFMIKQAINGSGKMIYITQPKLIRNVYYDMLKLCPDLKIATFDNKNKKTIKKIDSMDWDILITNLDKFNHDFEYMYNIFKSQIKEIQVVAVDECTSLKRAWDGTCSNRTFKFLSIVEEFYHQIPIKIGISGTPVENSISDIHALYWFVDQKLLGIDYDWYVNSFVKLKFRRKTMYGRKVTVACGIKGSKNEQQLKQLIRHKFIRRKHTDIPELKYLKIPVYLTNKEIDQYNLLIDDFNEEYKDVEEKPMKILEMSLQGFINQSESKIEILKEVLRNSKEKQIVFKESLLYLWLPVGLVLAFILPANFSTTAITFSMIILLVFLGGYPMRNIFIILGVLMYYIGYDKWKTILKLYI
jgi:SNF2 family DNA or RNA helicase